jgi:hypothetical protein
MFFWSSVLIIILFPAGLYDNIFKETNAAHFVLKQHVMKFSKVPSYSSLLLVFLDLHSFNVN